MKLYGWLIGCWTMEATVYLDDGNRHQGPGEIYFGWPLQGRAIQDVCILPGVFYGLPSSSISTATGSKRTALNLKSSNDAG
jgi:hypothetical protein